MTTTTLPQASARARSHNLKFVVGGLVIVAAIAFLIAMSINSTQVYYFTVTEAKAQLRNGSREVVRVNGVVDFATVKWDAQKLDLYFDMVEGKNRIPILYHGVMPDTFNQSESVVVEGTLNNKGVFDAKTLLVKCPSRYEPVVAPSN
jgi:cytochrome c-type biogenesis protein CcmE